ncbi:MAG: complex I subunit 5 family protein [Pseudomonadota bacterium]|nr:complex I subunit 5 family protein [Pseudomonadota bacterium]
MNNVILMFALPLLAAFLIQTLWRALGPLSRFVGPLTLLATGIIGLRAWPVVTEQPAAIAIGNFAPPLGITFYVDRLALLFALIVAFGMLALWPWGKVEDRPRTDSILLILAAAATGMALSGDLFNLYVFYELVAVATYGLIVSGGRAPAYAATFRYLIISAFGAALALIGIALVYTLTGTLNLAHLAEVAPDLLNNPMGLAAFGLFLIGFGVKAELFPVNTWVPEVYPSVPQRVAGLLAGVVSKLALIVIVRVMLLVFPFEGAHLLMLALGIAGVVFGELSAWRARDLSRTLGFSSIGQLGVMFIAFSVPGEAGLLAGLAVALHHTAVKPALFLLAERWGGSLARLKGAAGDSPLAAGLFVLLALSLIGIPPLPGFWAKLLTLVALFDQAHPLYLIGAGVILVGAVFETAYLFRIATGLYGTADAGQPGRETHDWADLLTAGALGAALLAGVVLLAPLGQQLTGIAAQTADRGLYVQTVHPTLPTFVIGQTP